MASSTETGWPSDRLASTKTSARGEEARDVVALPREAHGVREPARPDLLLQARAVGPVADDHRLERPRRQAAERPDEGREVLWRLEPADGDEQRRLPGGDRDRRRCDVHRVRDHDRRVVGARACREPGFALALRDADRRRRQRPHQPVRSAVSPGGETRVRRERPAVGREDPDRDTCERGREPAEHAGLGAVRVEDVRPFAPQQADQLDEAREVAERIDRAPHVRQRDEPCARSLGRVSQADQGREPPRPRQTVPPVPATATQRRTARRRPPRG